MTVKKMLVGAGTALVIGFSAAVGSVVGASAAPVGVAHPCYAKAIEDHRGPGLKNYRAYDAWCDGSGNYGGTWYGPWRLKRTSAQADAKQHNELFN